MSEHLALATGVAGAALLAGGAYALARGPLGRRASFASAAVAIALASALAWHAPRVALAAGLTGVSAALLLRPHPAATAGAGAAAVAVAAVEPGAGLVALALLLVHALLPGRPFRRVPLVVHAVAAAAALPLVSLPAGRYLLAVTLVDLAAVSFAWLLREPRTLQAARRFAVGIGAALPALALAGLLLVNREGTLLPPDALLSAALLAGGVVLAAIVLGLALLGLVLLVATKNPLRPLLAGALGASAAVLPFLPPSAGGGLAVWAAVAAGAGSAFLAGCAGQPRGCIGDLAKANAYQQVNG